MTPKEYAHGLRELADWYEQQPDETRLPETTLTVMFWDKLSLVKFVRQLGKVDKDYSGEIFTVSREFGVIKLRALTYRSNICERKVVGTRHIEAQVLPAHEEEIVEWECNESLLKVEEATDVS